MSQSIRVKRGAFSQLPADAPAGEILATTDTKQIFMGNGAGNSLIELCPVGTSSGTKISRYEIGGSGSMSYVHATGNVGDVTLSYATNIATLAATNSAHIFSCSIHFTAAQMTGKTNATIDFGANTADAYGNIPGTGINGGTSGASTTYTPQWMVWQDGPTPATRLTKTVAVAVLNYNSGTENTHAITFTNLTAAQAIWINLTF